MPLKRVALVLSGTALIAIVALISGILLGTTVFAAPKEKPVAAATVAGADDADESGSYLFTVSAEEGTFEPDGDEGTLTLRRVNQYLTQFADRPSRAAGTVSVAAFVESWEAEGFAEDPPNAALILPEHGAIVLVLSHPELVGRTLTFHVDRVSSVGSDTFGVFGSELITEIPAEFGLPSMFIDSATAACGPSVSPGDDCLMTLPPAVYVEGNGCTPNPDGGPGSTCTWNHYDYTTVQVYNNFPLGNTYSNYHAASGDCSDIAIYGDTGDPYNLVSYGDYVNYNGASSVQFAKIYDGPACVMEVTVK